MNCEDIHSLLTRIPTCRQTDDGARITTHCLYPSSDPVAVFIAKLGDGFRITDGGGAWRTALQHGRPHRSMFDAACRRHSVIERSGVLMAEPDSPDWLLPGILAVANASAMAARDALLLSAEKTEKSLNSEIFDRLQRFVPVHRIARNFEYRGRSGHLWPIDFAIMDAEPRLIKSVVQNGNSINSNYATFGDIGDEIGVRKYCVFSSELKPDSSALLQQVAVLVPLESISAAALRMQ